MPLRAGGAIANITPDRDLPNYNGAVHSRGDGDSDLLCHVIVIDDGYTPVVLVSCDATFVDRALLLRIRDACQRRTGIPGEHVMVAANHVHDCPATGVSFLSGALPDSLYLDFLIDRVAEAVTRAQACAQPACMVAGSTRTTGFEANRRRIRPDGSSAVLGWDKNLPLEGPVDDCMSFIAFEAIADDPAQFRGRDATTPPGLPHHGPAPLAFIVSYPVHNNCCGGKFYHRDVFGRSGDALREAMPSLQATVFLPGACGDVVCGDAEAYRFMHGDEFARMAGHRCADLLVQAYRDAPREDLASIRCARTVMEIPDRPFSESTFCRDGCRGTTEAALGRARFRYDPEEAAVKARGDSACPVEIAAITLDGAAIVTNPAELFVEFGIEIRERSPFETTLVSELTNGYCGYVPTERAFEHGGYETHRTVYTSRLVRDGGRRIVDASLELLRRLHGPS